MKAYIIGDENNKVSVTAVKRCTESLNYPLEFFQQTSPETLKKDMTKFPGLYWTYPINSQIERIEDETGMILKSYKTNDLGKKWSCTVSHAKLWKKCVELDEELMILEHDAIFIRDFKPFKWKGGVLGLNDPRGATHSSILFHEAVALRKEVQPAPYVKSKYAMPQGLAGNSAYIIKPYFAEKLLEKLKEKGFWPNDALMCLQFFPNDIKVVYPYYTRVQGVKSTTV